MFQKLREQRHVLAMSLAALALAALPCAAQNPPAVRLTAGGYTVTVDSTGAVLFGGNCPTPASPTCTTDHVMVAAGLIQFNATLGSFKFAGIVGKTHLSLGGPGGQDLELGSVNSKVGGTVTAALTDTNLSVSQPVGISGQSNGSATATSYTAYVDSSNTPFGQAMQLDQVMSSAVLFSDYCDQNPAKMDPGHPCINITSVPGPASMTIVTMATVQAGTLYNDDFGFIAGTVTPSALTLACPTTTGTVGTPYNSSLVAMGGVSPYTYSITPLASISPLMLYPLTGAITGTPTMAGTLTFTGHVVDSSGNSASNTATANCTITITPNPNVCTVPASQSIISNTSWNKFNTQGPNNVIWIHMHAGTPSNLSKTTTTTVNFTGVNFVLNGTTYHLPDGLLIFNPTAPAIATTTYDATFPPYGRWTTTFNPNNLSDEIFFDGQAVPVDSNITSGGQANLSFTTNATSALLNFNWQWSAAVFTYWPADNNFAKILPYHNSDHAGTPENTTVQKSLIQGPRGGGGSNFTGSWSATGQVTCPK